MGGPAAHIAMMEDEVVRRRRWMTHERFLDMLGVCNLIPGPNSTEMAIHIGQLRAGFAGLVVAGACFILPAAAIVMAIAWMYVRYGTMPQAVGLLYGIKPVIIAVVLQALWGLGRTAIKSRLLAAIAIVSFFAALFDVNDMIVLIGGGVVMMAIRAVEDRDAARATLAALPTVVPRASAVKPAAFAAAVVAVPFSLTTLFLFFLKVGAVLFGSGYVLLAFLRTDLVDRLHWLTQAQLLDAVAVGQVTPGPVFTTATFIGYILGGFRGAVVATLGIFLPSFFFVSISGPLIPHLRRSPLAGAFLDGVNVGAWALDGGGDIVSCARRGGRCRHDDTRDSERVRADSLSDKFRVAGDRRRADRAGDGAVACCCHVTQGTFLKVQNVLLITAYSARCLYAVVS